MPERLMGADCKFVGNMSTLVQIQLGPIIPIRRSTMTWNDITHPFVVLWKCPMRSYGRKRKVTSFLMIYPYRYLFAICIFSHKFSLANDPDSYQHPEVESERKRINKKKKLWKISFSIDLAITKRFLVMCAALTKVRIHVYISHVFLS